jgi:hypothetical protein
MLQHFESLSIDMPQPKYPLGTFVVIGENYGIITGTSFYGFNQHETFDYCDGWQYQISYSPDSPDWYLLDGNEWFYEAELDAVACHWSVNPVALDSQNSNRGLIAV